MNQGSKIKKSLPFDVSLKLVKMQFESSKPHFIRREKSSKTINFTPLDLFLDFGQKDEDKKISSDEN